jgi:uncharacterized protein YcnI
VRGTLVIIAAALGALAPSIAAAHTEPSLVGVPAGADATVSLQPTHGCGESPTVTVRIRAPLPDASAGEVEGWTASSAPDGAGNSVLEWTGGSLPTDEEGAFPVTFVAPDEVGRLLTFPAIQVCANGEELAWIDGDPAGEYPAPRVLVLPPEYEPAETLDEVPLDAPGRDQLVQVIDVDNPQTPTTTAATVPATAAPTVPATTSGPTTSVPAPTTPAPTSAPAGSSSTVVVTTTIVPSTSVETSAEGTGSSAAMPILLVAGLAVVGGGGAAYLVRRRSSASGNGSES